jgi:eukaryotic-like serine/threonine-protein kinase
VAQVSDVLGGRYRLVRLLGQGGMSDVYEAFDETTGTSVAVKIVRSNDPEYGHRLAQEAHALESFEHPALVRLLDVGDETGQAYFVMELIAGQTLAEALLSGPLPSKETAAIGARLAGALAYVHERGVVHRDVKPSNILLSSDGDAWLGDFGIAKSPEAPTLTVAGTTMGTVSYMAPEQLEDHRVGPPADIWSLGIILLECLTGHRVYEGTPSEVLARRLAGPVVVPDDLPAPWKVVLTGMLTQLPDQRLEAGQVSDLLGTHAYDAPWVPSKDKVSASDNTVAVTAAAGVGARRDETSVMQATRTVPASKNSFYWGWVVLGAVLVAAALGVGLFFLLGSSHEKSSPPSTTRPAKTTTTLLTGSAGTAALKALKSQVRAGETAGNVDSASGQIITQEAGLAQAAYTEGKTKQAGDDLLLVSDAISNGLSNHTIGQVEGQLLQSDLALLADALNLSSVVTTTSSTSTSSTTTSSSTTTTSSTSTTTTTTIPPTTTTTGLPPTTTVAS